VESHNLIYKDFLKGYQSMTQCEGIRNLESITLLKNLQRLDPRISEYVLQFPVFSGFLDASGESQLVSSDSRITNYEAFMPFILDCPIRTTAWEISTPIRQLAYALLNLDIPEAQQITIVTEHRRLQKAMQRSRHKGRELQLPTRDQLAAACERLIQILEKIQEISPLTSWRGWQVLAIHDELRWAFDNAKPPLSEKIHGKPRSGFDTASSDWITWDGVQFAAQLQCSYYSCRILQQILGVVLAHNSSGTLPPYLLKLQSHLKLLPLLADVPSINDLVNEFGSPQSLSLLSKAHTLMGHDGIDWEGKEPEVTKKSKKNKRKAGSTMSEVKKARQAPNNMFDILGAEIN